MNRVESWADKARISAYQVMMYDFLEKILTSAGQPDEVARYVAAQMRELSGARTVALFHCRHEFGGTGHRLVCVDPERRRGLVRSVGVEAMACILHDLQTAYLFDPVDSEQWHSTLGALDCGACIGVPLRVGEHRVGTLLLLDLPSRHRNAEILQIVDVLSTAVALVLRNALLHEMQEQIIAQRTEALRQSEATARALIDVPTDVVALLDREGIVLDANETTAQRLNLTRDDLLLGRCIWDCFPRDVADRRKTHIDRVFETGQLHRFEDERGGIWNDNVVSPVANAGGQVTRVAIMARDVTDRKRAEQALEAYSEQLERAVEARTRELEEAQDLLVRKERLAVLGQIAGGVGHDLRQPLAVISNAVYLLRLVHSEAQSVDQRQATTEYLDIIAAEVSGAEKTVADLLDFARIKVTAPAPLAAGQLVRAVLGKCQPPEHVDVVVSCAPSLPHIYADRQQLERVLTNLVTNAYQAMPHGGRLTVDVAMDESADAEADGQPFVRLSVGDTGVGIPAGNWEKVFEPLFTTKSRGIGLGLAVSKSLVEANGGRLEVDSQEGVGSTFTLLLPATLED